MRESKNALDVSLHPAAPGGSEDPAYLEEHPIEIKCASLVSIPDNRVRSVDVERQQQSITGRVGRSTMCSCWTQRSVFPTYEIQTFCLRPQYGIAVLRPLRTATRR